MSGPAVLTAFSVTSCACSSSIRMPVLAHLLARGRDLLLDLAHVGIELEELLDLRP